MNFRIIYVEDQNEDRQRLKNAVNRYNANTGPVTLDLILAKSPHELRQALDKTIDLILADVFFVMEGKLIDRLSEIIDAVTAWSLSNEQSSIPIIAYTGRGEDTLVSCLRRKDNLFDIWDKDSASPSYVTWRLSKLAIELSRLRPDTFMHRLIREMPSGASWHKFVTQMPNSYRIALTESGQIESVGSDIENIAHKLQVWHDPGEEMWDVMVHWEKLSRGVSSTIRGHARHVVNVFWLGYYLIHHKTLNTWFAECWTNALKARLDHLEHLIAGSPTGSALKQRFELLAELSLEIAKSGDPLESLSTAWFFAGLFHDVGGCVQKYATLRHASDQLIRRFDVCVDPVTGSWIPSDYRTAAEELFAEFDDNVVNELRPLWEQSLNSGEPDHGVVAALLFRKRFRRHQTCCAFEAARAMAVHNLIGKVNPRVDRLLSWNCDPLTCLLLLCDQIQTWDRERGDEDIFGPDYPARAQLTSLEVKEATPRPKIGMSIDYIVPHHVEHSTVLFERVTRQLERVLKDKPSRALARIIPDWPFELEVKCSLSGRPLGTEFSFGLVES